jgi:hypothetical protein
MSVGYDELKENVKKLFKQIETLNKIKPALSTEELSYLRKVYNSSPLTDDMISSVNVIKEDNDIKTRATADALAKFVKTGNFLSLYIEFLKQKKQKQQTETGKTEEEKKGGKRKSRKRVRKNTLTKRRYRKYI